MRASKESNMQDAMTVYFDGEKYAGLLLAGSAVAVVVVAAIMFRAGATVRPFAMTLGILALAEIVLGLGLYLRTGPQVKRLDQQLRSDPPQFYSAEAARMSRVQRTFVAIEYGELFIIVATAIAAVSLKTRPGLAGVALGLLVSASVLLAFDLFAEHRGADYVIAIANGQRPD
jgi:hypothetical protein